MERNDVLKSYARYAAYYDRLFGFSLGHGRREGVRLMGLKGRESVLEIGVGTGLSIPLYPGTVRLHGIDLSEPMLRLARERSACMGRENVRLEVMDAGSLRFDDDTFDVSVAMYVASVTPDPAAMVREMRRVTRPDGVLMVVNHFSYENTWVARIEKCAAFLSRQVGFHPFFSFQAFIRDNRLDGVQDHPVPPFGYWRVLRWRNDKIPVCRLPRCQDPSAAETGPRKARERLAADLADPA